MNELIRDIIKFRDDRDWKKYHTLDNLAKSISIASAELLENFQWSNEYDHKNVCDELADIMIYSIMAVEMIGESVEDIIRKKIQKNAIKYPLDRDNSLR
ncbi:MAG: nucleotide pyrophosphohydrolase [Clostridiales bacterium]|nr:nucleotide pyrophosphohydrolase [Clostridiales bacterium]